MKYVIGNFRKYLLQIFLVAIAVLVSVAPTTRVANAQLQPSSSGSPFETDVIDSKGSKIYRDGVAACRINCRSAAPSVATDGTPALPSTAPPAIGPTAKKDDGLTKEQKALILNAGAASAITAYGVVFWDYFQTAPKVGSEGWFGRTTKHGGADKLGHFWSTYTMGHAFSYVYRRWDFDKDQANTLGAVSSLGLQTLMEFGDAFSGGFGFSYEDALMNVIGAGSAYVLGKYPSLARKIDFRFLYTPEKFSDLTDDVLTNYDNQRYIVALKLDGFEALQGSYLSYLELHAGYFTRGYEEFNPGLPDNRERNLYFGVGLNVTKLVRKFADISVFDYIQVPYTTVGIDRTLD